MNHTQVKALRLVINHIAADERNDFKKSGKPDGHLWLSIETLMRFLQKDGLRRHLKSNVIAEEKYIEELEQICFITQKAHECLGSSIKEFVNDSLQVLGSHLQSFAENLTREGVPRDEWPMIHSVLSEREVVFLQDMSHRLFLIALKSEFRKI